MLYHAMARTPRANLRESYNLVDRERDLREQDQRSFEVLRSILEHGLLCAPENYKVYPRPKCATPLRRHPQDGNPFYDTIVNARICFTLLERFDLNRLYQTGSKPSPIQAHTDLFGRFAVGLNPVEARELGVLPVAYYYRTKEGQSSDGASSDIGNIIHYRLDEIRNILAVLSHIESSSTSLGKRVPNTRLLDSFGISLEHEPNVNEAVRAIRHQDADTVMRYFSTDRVPAWNIYDTLKMLLGHYQSVDDEKSDIKTTFFEQREWRLVHHMRNEMTWFSLGRHAPIRDPLRRQFAEQRRAIRRDIQAQRSFSGKSHRNFFFQNSWVLHAVNGIHVRSWIREIVVPKLWIAKVEQLVNQYPIWERGRPDIVPLSPQWIMKYRDGRPIVEIRE